MIAICTTCSVNHHSLTLDNIFISKNNPFDRTTVFFLFVYLHKLYSFCAILGLILMMYSNAAHMAAGDLKAVTYKGRYCESVVITILLKHVLIQLLLFFTMAGEKNFCILCKICY